MIEHPLIAWYAALLRAGAVRCEGTDVVLGALGGKRFGISVTDKNEPLLCCLEDDREVIESVPWTSAAMIFNHKRSDWVALSCKDARVRGSAEMNPVPLRLWIPVTVGRLDAWKKVPPKSLRVGVMTVNKNGPPTITGEPFINVPYKLIG